MAAFRTAGASTVCKEAPSGAQSEAPSEVPADVPSVPSAPAVPSAPVVPSVPAVPSAPAVPSVPVVRMSNLNKRGYGQSVRQSGTAEPGGLGGL